MVSGCIWGFLYVVIDGLRDLENITMPAVFSTDVNRMGGICCIQHCPKGLSRNFALQF